MTYYVVATVSYTGLGTKKTPTSVVVKVNYTGLGITKKNCKSHRNQ